MIQLPRRSVTRFFIPLIDVLTLLFCIFLLMPSFGETPQPDAAAPTPEAGRSDRHTTIGWTGLLQHEREELGQLQREKIETLQRRLALRVLEIDADTGKLYEQGPKGPVEIASQADARALINRDRQEADGRELYYLFLFPRRITGYPQQKQIQQYERWFEGVAHGIDNPRGGRGGLDQ
jgi:hypothetical protein